MVRRAPPRDPEKTMVARAASGARPAVDPCPGSSGNQGEGRNPADSVDVPQPNLRDMVPTPGQQNYDTTDLLSGNHRGRQRPTSATANDPTPRSLSPMDPRLSVNLENASYDDLERQIPHRCQMVRQFWARHVLCDGQEIEEFYSMHLNPRPRSTLRRISPPLRYL
ncbi:hypothetical protein EMCG_01755 [[Emmonsia] crescens]|uniref:Uncharacterized protein n=1 Tax=[Emmonsia] crescens TaxID=73230 RepID=A0A0G2J2A7_9EURO|nr:hypothetical protein EMCG_01755 [Emmonsia crescens UAMH 3008]